MTDIVLPYRWSPRPYQRPLWEYLQRGGTRAVACWHRRSGKDEVGLHHVACAAHQRVGNYWYMLPQYGQARKAMWDAVNPHTGKRRIDEAFPVEIRKSTREQEMLIVFLNGSTFQLVGSDNFNSLVGSPPVGLVFSEYALSNPSAWGYLRPILLENKGWAIFNSTPRGRNHFHSLLEFAEQEPGWFANRLGADVTDCFTHDQLQSELREIQAEHGTDYGYALWLQEYYCSFDAAIPGSIWGDCVKAAEDSGRVVAFPVAPASPVYTAWDLGRTDDTSIWWYQFNGKTIDLLDHHSSSLKDIPFYMDLLEQKRQEHGITYATHYLPHDARPRTLAAGGKSILQQCHDSATENPKLGKFQIGKRLDLQEGIQAARKTFPFCRFHATRCAKGLNSLRQYHREWDMEKKVFRDTPDHDWCLAGETKVLTRYGTCQIMDLPSTGEVLTLCGWKPYTHPRITRRNAPLVEVVFSDGLIVKCTPDHLFMTESGWTFAESLLPTSQVQSSLTRLRSISMAASTVYGQVINTFQEVGRSYIEMCGKVHSVLFPRGVTFITATMMPQIISYQTLNACLHPFIFQRTEHALMLQEQDHFSQTRQEVERLNGIVQKKGDCGIDAMPNAQKDGQNGSALTNAVQSVRRFLRDLIERVDIHKFIARKNAKWLHIVRVNKLHETADVWCLTVPGIEHFSLANGAIVHNSSHDADSFRYLSLSWKFLKQTTNEISVGDAAAAKSPIGMTLTALRDKHFAKRRHERAWMLR